MSLAQSIVLAGPLGLGGWEILALVFLIMLLFGAKRLPDLAKGLGKSIREFKKASTEDSSTDDHAEPEEASQPSKNGASKSPAKPAAIDQK